MTTKSVSIRKVEPYGLMIFLLSYTKPLVTPRTWCSLSLSQGECEGGGQWSLTRLHASRRAVRNREAVRAARPPDAEAPASAHRGLSHARQALRRPCQKARQDRYRE